MKRVLLVEGDDDKHVVRHLRDHPNHPDIPRFCILNKNGYPNLEAAIGLEIKAPGRLVVGILADANNFPDRRWQAIANRLRKANIEPPPALEPDGTVIEGTPRVGIWLMPDNRLTGELENFIEQLIPADDRVWPLAQTYIDGIPEADRKFSAGKIERARIHAWLAARKEPRKMGASIGYGDLDATVPLAMSFTAWLRRLFC